jgi:hypothetical protein
MTPKQKLDKLQKYISHIDGILQKADQQGQPYVTIPTLKDFFNNDVKDNYPRDSIHIIEEKLSYLKNFNNI